MSKLHDWAQKGAELLDLLLGPILLALVVSFAILASGRHKDKLTIGLFVSMVLFGVIFGYVAIVVPMIPKWGVSLATILGVFTGPATVTSFSHKSFVEVVQEILSIMQSKQGKSDE